MVSPPPADHHAVLFRLLSKAVRDNVGVSINYGLELRYVWALSTLD